MFTNRVIIGVVLFIYYLVEYHTPTHLELEWVLIAIIILLAIKE